MILQHKSHDVTHPSSDSQIFDSLRLKAKLFTQAHVFCGILTPTTSPLPSPLPPRFAYCVPGIPASSLYLPQATLPQDICTCCSCYLVCSSSDICMVGPSTCFKSLLSRDLLSKLCPLSYTLPALSASFFFINFITAYINILQLFVYLFLDSPPLESHTMRAKALEKKQGTKTGPSGCLHSRNSTSGH